VKLQQSQGTKFPQSAAALIVRCCLKATPDYMEAGKASILCSCEPAAAMVLGFFLFREIPAVLVLSNKKPEIVEENDHVKR
jgi:hypothetical protein